ncbi:MAG: leucyl aminopeptidase family protein, partial [Rhodobacteraceae bacterium]|nr:leucyl aminopeptidase family protein [Paracoccaceae bacterium]
MSHALRFARPDQFPDTDAIPVHVISADGADAALAQLDSASRQWAMTHSFSGALGKTCLLPNEAGGIAAVLLGVGTSADRIRKRFAAGAAISDLPKGLYEVASASLDGHPQNLREEIALGYLLAGYRFDRYHKKSGREAALVAIAGIDAPHFERLAQAEAMVRDMVNTPAQDMGPEELEGAARDLAARYNAKISVIVGDDLLAQNFPMIHAVGRASPRAPRLIDMNWGEDGPQITLVGKGVCFDTGGLNLKPGSSMGTMKKDMGG